jgi:hypothetical protein
MTDERDFDRLARAWLDLGPDLAPDRSVAAVLQAVEVTPQVRPWRRWPSRRNTIMTRLMPVAAVVAVAAVALGGLFIVNRPSQGGVGSPTAVPSAAPTLSSSAVAAGTPIPAAIRGHWIGEPRPVGTLPPMTRTSLNLDLDSYHFGSTDLPGGLLGSVASATAPGQITLVTPASATGPCLSGDTGVYTYTLSSGGTMLHATKTSEDCAARGDAVVGDWYRVACKDTADACWGPLEAGTYPSQYIDPRLGSGTWAPILGAIAYTVPAGWANGSDWPNQLSLVPEADYAAWTKDGAPPDTFHGIWLMAQPRAAARPADCSHAIEPGISSTVDGLYGWVTSRPGIKIGDSGTIAIGKYAGKWVDLSVDPKYTFACTDATDPAKVALVGAGEGVSQTDWWLGPNEHMRAIFVDIGQGDVVAIGIDTTDPSRFDQLVSDSMPIVQSFTFK